MKKKISKLEPCPFCDTAPRESKLGGTTVNCTTVECPIFNLKVHKDVWDKRARTVAPHGRLMRGERIQR